MRAVDQLARGNEVAHLREDDAVALRAPPGRDAAVFLAQALHDPLDLRVRDKCGEDDCRVGDSGDEVVDESVDAFTCAGDVYVLDPVVCADTTACQYNIGGKEVRRRRT